MRSEWMPTPMGALEKSKYEAARQLGLLEKLLRVGWGGLTAEETGRIGGLVSRSARLR